MENTAKKAGYTPYKGDLLGKMAEPPALFIPHGAPDLILTDHPAAVFLRQLGAALKGIKGIIVMSAHWETNGLYVTAPGPLDTIYDFSGFARQLYRIKYKARSEKQLIDALNDNLRAAGLEEARTKKRGLDHGAWAPLSLMFPDANIPVIQLSLDRKRSPEELNELGQALTVLRKQNILLLGSGATTHNLRHNTKEGTPPPQWAVDFEAWLDYELRNRNSDNLHQFEKTAPDAKTAHPTTEHFLPLFFARGAGGPGATADKLHESYQYSALSMSTWAFS